MHAQIMEKVERTTMSVEKLNGVLLDNSGFPMYVENKGVISKIICTTVSDGMFVLNTVPMMANSGKALTARNLLGMIAYEESNDKIYKDLGSNENFWNMPVVIHSGEDCNKSYDKGLLENFHPLSYCKNNDDALYLQIDEDLQCFKIPITWIEKHKGFAPVNAYSREQALQMVLGSPNEYLSSAESQENFTEVTEVASKSLVQSTDSEIIMAPESTVNTAMINKVFTEVADYQMVNLTEKQWSEIVAEADLYSSLDYTEAESVINSNIEKIGYKYDYDNFRWYKEEENSEAAS